MPLATVGGVRTPPGGIRTIAPSHLPGPIFGPSAAPSAVPPTLPPPEPSGTPYHFASQHLYVAGFNNAAPNKFGHIWRYTLPITDSAQPPDVDLRLSNVPNGLAVDNEGNLFVAVIVPPNTTGDSLLEFALPLASGSQKIASGGTTPADAIAIDYHDRLFVTNPTSQTLDVYAHSIFTSTGPAFSMPDPFPGNPVDAAAGPGGEIFVTQYQPSFGPGVAKLIKYQVPFSVTRQPVVVQDSLDTESFVGFTRLPQRIYLPEATAPPSASPRFRTNKCCSSCLTDQATYSSGE
ncbi:MAG: hypothetical protein JO219_11600 [Candidatus Eremiobacteraeota bacterium]|nr:hypothetical protein [Candidatus Eremiobacteraeota bacterium]